VTLAKLQLCPNDIVYDIGAGTGSVAVEMARQLQEGWVYAIEKEPEGLELTERNMRKFGIRI
jgi:precorrin-6Y C5,15-methyltransferase (decarboxylating)